MHDDENYLNQAPSELGRQFQVIGRFYLYAGSAQSYPCRDLLEIRRRDSDGSTEADAVFVMMNPGSSKPLAGDAGVPFARAVLVQTKPDTTQYQLMRLMSVMDWRYVKVINLSDLRVARSADFFKRVREFQEQERHDGHSLFANPRRQQLLTALNRRSGAPIVAAWGVDAALRRLAANAKEALDDAPVIGLSHANGPWAYRHPLPQPADAQARWRRDALSMLRTLASAP